MNKTVELAIPKTAAERIAAREHPRGQVTAQWLEGLCAHVDEDGLIGEPAAKYLLREVLRLRSLLEEVEDYFDDHADVVDGDYGVPAPNTEMQWAQRIKETLGKGGY